MKVSFEELEAQSPTLLMKSNSVCHDYWSQQITATSMQKPKYSKCKIKQNSR